MQGGLQEGNEHLTPRGGHRERLQPGRVDRSGAAIGGVLGRLGARVAPPFELVVRPRRRPTRGGHDPGASDPKGAPAQPLATARRRTLEESSPSLTVTALQYRYSFWKLQDQRGNRAHRAQAGHSQLHTSTRLHTHSTHPLSERSVYTHPHMHTGPGSAQTRRQMLWIIIVAAATTDEQTGSRAVD